MLENTYGQNIINLFQEQRLMELAARMKRLLLAPSSMAPAQLAYFHHCRIDLVANYRYKHITCKGQADRVLRVVKKIISLSPEDLSYQSLLEQQQMLGLISGIRRVGVAVVLQKAFSLLKKSISQALSTDPFQRALRKNKSQSMLHPRPVSNVLPTEAEAISVMQMNLLKNRPFQKQKLIRILPPLLSLKSQKKKITQNKQVELPSIKVTLKVKQRKLLRAARLNHEDSRQACKPEDAEALQRMLQQSNSRAQSQIRLHLRRMNQVREGIE